MTYPENTTKRDPGLNLLGIMSEGQSNYIEGMEAAGQRQFVESSVIPSECDEAALTALGFVLGKQVPGDDLFRECTLPAGWSKEATDHSMGSNIVDELGRKRVSVFYKAAFYDRRASASVVSLYGYLSDCAYYGSPVVYDDVWATREAVAGEASKAAESCRQRAAEYASYYPAGIDDEVKRAEQFEALAAEAMAVQAPADGA